MGEADNVKCPHCLTDFHDEPTMTTITRGAGLLIEGDGTSWQTRSSLCPACGRATIVLVSTRWVNVRPPMTSFPNEKEWQVWPKGIARAPLSKEVPEVFANDYREACNTLADSPRASAAMSRFCLQRLLREKAGVRHGDLSSEIDQVLSSGALPSDLAADLDAIRAIGNFGAHPIKSKNTGEIVDVEPGEAEHLLTVLEELFDFYFVRPAERAAKRGEINKKLADAGKPPLKVPPK